MKGPQKKTKPNGKANDSMDLLAKAMRVAFQDSVEAGLAPMEKRMDAALMKTRKAVSNELKKTREDIRKSVAKQFASRRP